MSEKKSNKRLQFLFFLIWIISTILLFASFLLLKSIPAAKDAHNGWTIKDQYNIIDIIFTSKINNLFGSKAILIKSLWSTLIFVIPFLILISFVILFSSFRSPKKDKIQKESNNRLKDGTIEVIKENNFNIVDDDNNINRNNSGNNYSSNNQNDNYNNNNNSDGNYNNPNSNYNNNSNGNYYNNNSNHNMNSNDNYNNNNNSNDNYNNNNNSNGNYNNNSNNNMNSNDNYDNNRESNNN